MAKPRRRYHVLSENGTGAKPGEQQHHEESNGESSFEVPGELPAEFVRRIFTKAAEVLQSSPDPRKKEETWELIGSAFQIGELLDAFKKSPRCMIHGPDGVAAQLRISREAVYCRLEALSLTAADFRVSGIEVGDLIKKSKVLRTLARKLIEKLVLVG